VLTKTWFNTGAFFGKARISRYLAYEYLTESGLNEAQSAAIRLPDTAPPTTILRADDTRLAYNFSGEELREACRALRGSILRQAVYALDPSNQSGQPYCVSERNYTLEVFQPRRPNPFGVFLAHARESLDLDYECKLYLVGGQQVADPKVWHSMVLAMKATPTSCCPCPSPMGVGTPTRTSHRPTSVSKEPCLPHIPVANSPTWLVG
jgi:hypothetical protein